MPRFKTRHLILAIAVVAEGLGAYSLLMLQPRQQAAREARENYIFAHERAALPRAVAVYERSQARYIRRAELLAEKWDGQGRPDRADRYRKQAAYLRFQIDLYRRTTAWHAARRDALARRGSFDLATERAVDQAKEAEFRAEVGARPNWATIFDWPDRPPEDATFMIP